MDFLSFGEIIYDMLPNGKALGGASLNVAVHLARLGGVAYLVSAVGADDLGREAINEITGSGVCSDYITLSQYDTGRADVSLNKDGSGVYSFNMPAAWDEIRLFPQEYDKIISKRWDGFVFGTLAQRSDISKETLVNLLDSIQAQEILFDVNLRGDFYSFSELDLGFSKATILKLNEEELKTIAPLMSCSTASFAEKLFSMYRNIKGILLTRGAKGISYITRDEELSVNAGNNTVVDTIGAGDSVSAAFLYYLLKAGEPLCALQKASAVAGFVVSTRGAFAPYSEELINKLKC